MITDEERRLIVNEAVEKALLMLPEVVGNLILNHVNLLRINRKFYERYPDLINKKDIVASVVELVEGENPGLDYQTILDKAVPLIQDRIRTIAGLDMKNVTRPKRQLPPLNVTPSSDHGDL